MIFSNNLFKNLSSQPNPLKRPVAKLSISHFADLKPVTLLKTESLHNESLSDAILGISLLRNFSKQRHIKGATSYRLAFSVSMF